ncbi:MAG: hypothetical protein JWM62_1111 [Frankiales bacterium]|jgi:hypothetical protein|nr:hypothetical protein [Frankiales bacterium]
MRSSVQPATDPAFDEALARIRELSTRLHAVVDLHDARRTLLGTRVCRCCSRRFPCPTVQHAAG